MAYKTMDDVDFQGKTVLVRSDLDSPFDGDILDNQRLMAAAKTLKELGEKGAKVVTFGHQARPGKKSFTRMAPHARLLEKHIGKPVQYVDSLHDSRAQAAIKALNPGEILLLENTRFSGEEMLDLKLEEYAGTHFARDLAPLFDYFVQNAFTNAHRQHVSMVGFRDLPQIAGRRFALEVEGIRKAALNADRPYVMVLGGAKIFDYFSLIEKVLGEDTVDQILVGGLLVDLCLLAQGYQLGAKEAFLAQVDSLAKQSLLDLLPQVKQYMEQYPDKFVVPTDLAIEVDGKRQEIDVSELPTEAMIYDIGSKSAARYAEVIAQAKTIYLKGPVGMYENPEFELGSKVVAQAIADSDGFSLVGGGDSVEVVERFADLDKISHVGLAGGATLKMLAGKKLIALEVLEGNV